MLTFHRSSSVFKSIWFLIQRKLFLLSCSPVRHALQMEECKKLPQLWEYLYFHGKTLCRKEWSSTRPAIRPTWQLWKQWRSRKTQIERNPLTLLATQTTTDSYSSSQPLLKPGPTTMRFSGQYHSNDASIPIIRQRSSEPMDGTKPTDTNPATTATEKYKE